jgi:hypothetical protein
MPSIDVIKLNIFLGSGGSGRELGMHSLLSPYPVMLPYETGAVLH